MSAGAVPSGGAASSPGFRLPTGQVTVLLGPEAVRRGLLGRLDGGSARCPSGHAMGGVVTVASGPTRTAPERISALAQAAEQRPSVVLVDRVTDGLTAADRRTVLAELRTLAAAGPAVLVDDTDPIAALAVADTALRASADGSLQADELRAPVDPSGI
jgi:hypothetical protein